MRRLTVTLLLCLSLCSGCTLTLHSLFTAKDLVFDEQLVGRWTTQDADIWDIKPFDKNTGRYTLHTTETDRSQGEFYAYLGRIGAARFLELVPKRPNAVHAQTFFGGHFVPLRSFWKVALDGDALTLTSMSIEWLEGMIKQNKVNIKYEESEGGDMLFLTASTQELQEFVAKYADDVGAFPSDKKGLSFNRMKEQKAQ